MSVLQVDFETRSAVDLKKTGVYPYSRDPSTGIWCFAWAFDDDEPVIWTPEMSACVPGDPYVSGVPLEFWEHIQKGGEYRGWNSGQFERIIHNVIMVERYGFPPLTIEQVHDTAAEAAAMALPRALGKCAAVLNVDAEKDAEGNKLAKQMCRPRKARKGEDPEGVYWWDDTERLGRLFEYCKQDVRTERAVARVLRRLSPGERAVYTADQRINDRGVRVDLALVRAARHIVDRGTEVAAAELSTLTNGAVTSVTKVADLKAWLAAGGLTVESLNKNAVRDLLSDGELPPEVERALTIRQEVGKSSTAKLDAFVHATCSDGYGRGWFLYHGASTGRWAGKLVQPQNFPRTSKALKNIEDYIPLVLEGKYERIDMEHPPVLVVSNMLRSMMIASPGCILRAGDFAQIEARVLAWIAGQDDLLELFANDGKVYEDMAAYIYSKPIEEIGKDSEERQIGKNTVLGCGYQMGAERYRTQAQEQTGIDLGEELSERAVKAYREKNQRIVGFWKDINAAAVSAVMNPESVHAVGRRDGIKFIMKGQYLWCQLPSGRFLCYALPQMRKVLAPWGRKKQIEGNEEYGQPLVPSDFTTSLTHMGVDALTKQWRRQPTYGGSLTENVVQAMARDLMAAAMLRLEEKGYPVVLHAHDEIVCDVPQDHGSQEEFLSLMAARPRWAHDVPVKVEGWQRTRYRK